jgi:hypothetical protein
MNLTSWEVGHNLVLWSFKRWVIFLMSCRVLCILDTSPLSDIWFANISSILIFLYLLRLSLCLKTWSIFEKVPWPAEKNVYYAIAGLMNETGGCYVKWNKPGTERPNTTYSHSYVEIKKLISHESGTVITRDSEGQGDGGRDRGRVNDRCS